MPSSSSSSRRRGRNKAPSLAPELAEVASDEVDLPLDSPSAVHHNLYPAQRPAVQNPSPPGAQAHRAMLASSSSSSSSGRRRGRRGRKGPAPATVVAPAAVEARDWAELPMDILTALLHKLDHIEILMGAGQVCRSWRSAARDVAVRRSAGQCEAFWGEYAADEDLLHFLGDRAPSLKSLCLISCYHVLEGFAEAIKKFPLLEELELSLCPNISGNHVFEVVGIACPQLRRFRLSNQCFFSFEESEDNYSFEGSEDVYNKDEEAQGIATMHELRSLQLFANNITNAGLTTILDNCPHLESPDIRHCFNVNMEATLLAKCSHIKALRLPYDSTDDYDFQVQAPVWSGYDLGIQSDSDECFYGGPDYILDSDEYDDYCDPHRYLDGVYLGRPFRRSR
ncbi:hypothetical protein BRADI_3g17399v3 [Brachypodium distachyon]|uniref:F-box domain-containing protein n=1 Tax=Brachypodium distachyon TaxID=15368 RepID=A0A0Q3F6W5_BRADI|nr:hypothetical protein BRADI_3g17399v3 [Brachypodium distachyon]